MGDYETVSYTPTQAAHLESYSRLDEGATFTDRYTILGEIGRGGMGIVYKAHDNVLNTTVALKIIHPLISSHSDVVRRFKQETLLARSVSHENVVRIHDIGELEGLFYLSMDYIEGQNLKRLLLSNEISSQDEKIEVSKQICRALIAAHGEGIVHRDLKPQNIMVDKKGRLFVSDFGLAKSLEAHDTIFPEGIVGTPPYMSPEQSKGIDSDQRSDIYSLGIIFYEMFTGQRPFEAETRSEYLRKHIQVLPLPPMEVNPQIPEYLQKIILKCLEKDPQYRYSDAGEVLAELERRGRAVPSAKDTKIRKIFGGTAAAATLIMVAFLVYYWIWGTGGADVVFPPASARISVAVMDFENASGNQEFDGLPEVAQNFLYQDLIQSRFLRVLPDDKLLQVLDDLGIIKNQGYSLDLLTQIGIDFNVTYFLRGKIKGDQEGLGISVSIQEAQTGEIIGTVMSSGQSVDDIDIMVDDLTLQIKNAFNLTEKQINADIDATIGEIYTESEKAFELYMAGRRFNQERHPEDAKKALLEALKIDPQFAMAYLELSTAYSYLNDKNNRIDSLLKASSYTYRVSERNRMIIQGHAAIEFENSYLKSIGIFKQLVTLYPHDLKAYGLLAWMYRQTEDWEKARDCYQIMANSTDNVNRAVALDNLAWVNLTLGNYEEALEIMLANKEAFTNQAWYYRFLANIYICSREYDAAYDAALEALKIEPDYEDNFRLKGNVQLLREEFADAGRTYSAMIGGEQERMRLTGMYWLANLYLTLGQYQESLRVCREGIALAKKSGDRSLEADLWLLLSHIDIQLENFEGLDETSSELVELTFNIDSPSYRVLALHWSGMARLFNRGSEEAMARARELKALVDETGMHKKLRNQQHLLGLIALEEGDLDGAILQFEEAITKLPYQNYVFDNHALFLNSAASAHARQKNYDKAWERYEQISQLSSGRMTWGDLYVLSFYEMGKLAQLQNRDDEAVSRYKKFLSLWSDADPGLDSVKDARDRLARLESGMNDGN